ncbi:MAG: hypothetical protein AAF289_11975, partial [Cyanobacteria bacterium P01_A01_bin.135]
MQECSTAIVIYEDRPDYETGIKLLTSSLLSHASNIDIHIFAPNATPDFRRWVGDRPVSAHYWSPSPAAGFNVKPDTLLWALEQGYKQVIWLDDDIIVTRPLPDALLLQPPTVMVLAEISRRFKTRDCVALWDLPFGRSFPVNPSACCFRVTAEHIGFLQRWKDLINAPDYCYWQSQPRQQRPIHMVGSDAVLHALLGSQFYQDIPLHLLRMGRDIAQCITPSHYTVGQRLMSLWWGVPPLVHAIGRKPWLAVNDSEARLALSPYACCARRLKALKGEAAWLTVPARWALWRRLTRDHPALLSLPLAFTRPSIRRSLS